MRDKWLLCLLGAFFAGVVVLECIIRFMDGY